LNELDLSEADNQDHATKNPVIHPNTPAAVTLHLLKKKEILSVSVEIVSN
jgi:hypothetical protein